MFRVFGFRPHFPARKKPPDNSHLALPIHLMHSARLKGQRDKNVPVSEEEPCLLDGRCHDSSRDFFLAQIHQAISNEIKFASFGRIASGTVEAKRVDTEVQDGRTHSYLVVSYVFDPLTSLP